MKRALQVSLLALVTASPAIGAEGGAILGGEHPAFSRIVMAVEPTTEWSLEPSAESVAITFPGKQLDFSTAGVFDKMPRDRIGDVRVETPASGTRVVVELNCDCRMSTTYVNGAYLALDISDRPDPAEQSAGESGNGTDPGAQARAGDPSTAATEPGMQDGRPPAPGLPRDASRALGELRDPMDGTPDQTGRDGGAAGGAGARTDALVYAAEEQLLRQIERAARQGIITLPGDDGEDDQDFDAVFPQVADTTPPPPLAPPTVAAAPRLPAWQTSDTRQIEQVSTLLDHELIEATTVFDRYGVRARERARKTLLPTDCIPDHRLDIDFWASGAPMFEQVAELRGRLFGEFDKVNPTAVVELAKVYLRFGFGAEAEVLLESLDQGGPDKRLLIDLARVIDGRAVDPFGPLARQTACPGRHGLWLAAGGAAPAYQTPDQFASVQEAFSELPPDLRMLIGPRLMGNLLDAGKVDPAALIHDTLARLRAEPTPELELATARLRAAQGNPLEAIRMMSGLVERGAPNAIEALTRMVQLGLDEGYAVPERIVTDLEAAAMEYRRTPQEPVLRGLVAKALAARGQMAEAIGAIRDAKADLDDDAYFDRIAVEILAKSDPQTVGLAVYARVALASEDLVSEHPDNDEAREMIGSKLLDLGLAEAARDYVAVAAGRRPRARLLFAEAHLALSEPETARRIVAGVPGPEAVDIRARALFMEGNFSGAQAELDRAGKAEEADTLAWSSGDWQRAERVAQTPEKASMAKFMAARTGAEEALPPAMDPARLGPSEAFVEPLPQLEDPSLDAARRLLATGGQVEEFIQSVLRGKGQESE